MQAAQRGGLGRARPRRLPRPLPGWPAAQRRPARDVRRAGCVDTAGIASQPGWGRAATGWQRRFISQLAAPPLVCGQFEPLQERYAIRRPELGHGAFGAVYAGRCLRSGEPVAVKAIDKAGLEERLGGAGRLAATLRNEITVCSDYEPLSPL